MSDLTTLLIKDESILFRTRKHKIIFLVPAIITLFILACTPTMLNDIYLRKLVIAPWVVAIGYWALAALEYAFSDYIVTNKRLLMREGFFFRHMSDLRLATIAQLNVNQSLLGQLCNYGTVSINAFGAEDRFDTIADPFTLQRTVNNLTIS